MEIQIRNIERLRYFLSAVLLMVAVSLFAQSNGDKLFMEGQALQQKQTIASQRQAVKKFEAAKVVYATAGKKKMCDNQIAICYNNINALRRASSKGIKEKKTEPQNQEEMLSLSQHAVAFEGDKKGKSMVAVTAPRAEWKFSLSEGIDGEDNFAKVSKSLDAKSLNIEVDINPLTTERHQNIVVSLDGQNDTLHVTQKGKEVLLSTSTNLVEFKLKGGNKSIELYTNSDSIINSNNGLTWYVKSKPEWIETAVDVNRKKSALGKGLSALKGLVSKSTSKVIDEKAKVSIIRIIARPLIKSDPSYASGRFGEIVFASQYKTHTIKVIQQ